MAATIGDYVILRRGGFGVGVPYRVRHMGTGTESTLKVVPDRHASDGVLEEIARVREALESIRDRGVLVPEDAGADSGGTAFLVYPASEGHSFSEVLVTGARAAEDVRALALALLGALEAAHSQRIVHGSLEPRCIVIQEDSNPAIIDFGFRSLTPRTSRTFLQSDSRYWAPELAEDSPGTPAGDMFAVGALLRQALGGDIDDDASGVHPREALREDDALLVELIAALTSADPEQRPSAEEAIAMLRQPVAAAAPVNEQLALPSASSGFRNISLFGTGSPDEAPQRPLIALLGITAVVAVAVLALAGAAFMLLGGDEPNTRREVALATATPRPVQGARVPTAESTRGGVAGAAVDPTIQPTLAPEPTTVAPTSVAPTVEPSPVAPTAPPAGVSEPAVSTSPVAPVAGDSQAVQSSLEDRAAANTAFYRSRDVADVASFVTGSALATYQAEAARLIAIDAYIESTQTQMVIERFEASGDRANAVTIETWEHVDRRASTDALLGSRRATARITYGLVYRDGRWLVDSISHQILTITPL